MMAKTGVFDGGPAARAAELKRELQRLVMTIVDREDEGDDDVSSVGTIDRAMETMCVLKELKKCKGGGGGGGGCLKVTFACPEEFRCPISKELMRDPVILATGQVRAHLIWILHHRIYSSFFLVSSKRYFQFHNIIVTSSIPRYKGFEGHRKRFNVT